MEDPAQRIMTEVWWIIFDNLDLTALLEVRKVCKRFNSIISAKSYIKRKCNQEAPTLNYTLWATLGQCREYQILKGMRNKKLVATFWHNNLLRRYKGAPYIKRGVVQAYWGYTRKRKEVQLGEYDRLREEFTRLGPKGMLDVAIELQWSRVLCQWRRGLKCRRLLRD